MHDSATLAKTVRVSLPASVASNIDGLKRSLATVMGKVGCDACCSGHDIRLELQREFLAGRDMKRSSAVGGWAGSLKREVPQVKVGLSSSAGYDIKQVFLAIDKLADLSGHVACATGCDIFFQMEEMFVLDEMLNIEAPAVRFG